MSLPTERLSRPRYKHPEAATLEWLLPLVTQSAEDVGKTLPAWVHSPAVNVSALIQLENDYRVEAKRTNNEVSYSSPAWDYQQLLRQQQNVDA